MTREEIEQALEARGWRIDDGFSTHLIVGNNHTLSILAHQWVWESDDPVFEISDEGTDLTYWVREIPTPAQAQELINEHGGPADEQRGKTYKQEEQ